MGYFANGTEGEAYFNHYCRNCRNCGDAKSEEGCVVWDLHLCWNYDAVSDEFTTQDTPPLHGPTLRAALDSLIPRDASGRNGQCLMFRERAEPAQESLGQLTMLERFDATHGAPCQ
jgi:hypothetical protein